MMLTGAYFGVVADLAWHNYLLATGVAIVAGGLMALIHAVVSIRFRADQIVSGIAINIFAAGLTVFLVNRIFGLQDVGHVGQADLLPNWNVPVLSSNPFVPNMTDGRGYIALAAMIFGKWTPRGAFVACLIFGLGEAIYANNSTIRVSQYLLSMLPYLLTLIVIAGVVGRRIPPAADGIPYVPGSE